MAVPCELEGILMTKKNHKDAISKVTLLILTLCQVTLITVVRK